MRDQKDIIRMAANIKIRILNRNKQMLQTNNQIVQVETGVLKMHPERFKTLKQKYEHFVSENESDIIMFAVFRWILGITDDIDLNNLELDR